MPVIYKIVYNREYHEYRVKFYDAYNVYLGEGLDYYTDDKEDAIATAKASIHG